MGYRRHLSVTGFNPRTIKKKSIELSLVLTSSFRLLLPLQAGAYIMLSLLNFLDGASLLAAALKSLQSTF